MERFPRLHWIERLLPHDFIYNDGYFTFVDREAVASAPGIVEHLVRHFSPRSVLDVGCGTGAMLAEFRQSGVSRLCGLEYAEAALARCLARGLDVRKFDLETDRNPDLPQTFDLVVSFEVAEHLPSSAARAFVSLLSAFRAPVVLTAAPPGQGGTDHVNEQPRTYWVDLFRDHSMDLDENTSAELSSSWKASGVTWWYHQNVMVFRPLAMIRPQVDSSLAAEV
jgi:SAM-dependent methyltransferase